MTDNPSSQEEALMTTRRLPVVREFMDRYVETISPETDIMEAVDFLLEKRVTGAPVANGKGELVGMLTEFDCLKLLTLGDERHDAPRGKVIDFMTAKVQSIPPTMDIYYCAGLFMNVSFRRFPVVEGGRIVGAITRFDLLRAVRRSLATPLLPGAS
jgi:CBS domain-containing protein